MNIWVDADACPKVIKEIIFRAAARVKIKTTLVANQWLSIPKSPYLHFVQVKAGFDVADGYIVTQQQAGDLTITADIPLAYEIVQKNGYALNPRGEFYNKENIGERLAVRDLMSELRSTGEVTGGPAALTNKDKLRFANALDKFLVKPGF